MIFATMLLCGFVSNAAAQTTYGAKEFEGSLNDLPATEEEAGECWHDPYPSDAMNYSVPCDSPACNVGPCTKIKEIEQLVIPSDDQEPTEPGTQSTGGTEDINIGVGELEEEGREVPIGQFEQHQDRERAGSNQNNETDLNMVGERAAENGPNLLVKILKFLTAWWWF